MKDIPIEILIAELESRIEDPTHNLPYELFLFFSRNMAVPNVDILVRHPKKGTLLCWRDDDIFGQGWHVPGRIIRYKNPIRKTLIDCLDKELGIKKEHADNLTFVKF